VTGPQREPAEWITRLKKQYGAPDDVVARTSAGTGYDDTDPVTGDGVDDEYYGDDDGDEGVDQVGVSDRDQADAPLEDDDVVDDPDDEQFDGPADVGGGDGELRLVDLDDAGDSDDDETSGKGGGVPRRFNPWVASGFGVAAVIATIVTLVIGSVTSRDAEPAPTSPSPVAKPAPGPPPVSQVSAAADGPLHFTATSSCDRLPGSTPAQLLADPNSDAPWVCATDTPGEYVTLVLDRPARITAVAITPGAVIKGNSANQADPWPQYRVVKRVQWGFNDTANTAKPQDTQLTHGEVRMAMPSILTTVVTVLIQETARPPRVATPATAVPKPANGDFLGPILGGGSGLPATNDQGPAPDEDRPDPSDGKFAISSIRLIGHEV
jgi:hypothetical protein